MTERMTRERVAEIVTAARDNGERPNLRYEHLANLDLRGLDLSRADLNGSFLAGANLSGAHLHNANLTGANLHSASLNGAYLTLANLTDAFLGRANLADAHLVGAFLSRSDLYGANLSNADLRRAYLAGAGLSSANLAGANLTGLAIEGLPSGPLTFIPTLRGWSLRIGCWDGTIDGLREMIAQDCGWPEAEGEEIAYRRPMLAAAADMCDAYAAAHPDALAEIKDTADRWMGI